MDLLFMGRGNCCSIVCVGHIHVMMESALYTRQCVQSFFCFFNFVEQVGAGSVKTLLISIKETRMSFVHSCDFTRFQPLTAIQALLHFQLFYPLSAIFHIHKLQIILTILAMSSHSSQIQPFLAVPAMSSLY